MVDIPGSGIGIAVQMLQPIGSVLQAFKHPKGSLPNWSKLAFSRVFSGVTYHASYQVSRL